jgi:hypothetical protein
MRSSCTSVSLAQLLSSQSCCEQLLPLWLQQLQQQQLQQQGWHSWPWWFYASGVRGLVSAAAAAAAAAATAAAFNYYYYYTASSHLVLSVFFWVCEWRPEHTGAVSTTLFALLPESRCRG